MQAKKARKIIIIGGSMSGLFAALLLRQRGFEVEIYERSRADLEGRGAGIVTHPELFAILARAGISIEPKSLGVAVEGRRILDRAGGIVVESDYPQVLASWGRLYNILKKSLAPVRVQGGASLDSIESNDDGIVAHFADGRSAKADLLVGADGLFSAVRRQFLPAVEPIYAGYVAWRGMVDEADLSQATRDTICDHFAFCLPTGEQMLGYPVSGAGETVVRGQRRYNFVWYRPAGPELLRGLLTDIKGDVHILSIPPVMIRPEVMREMRSEAARVLAPAFAEVVQKTREPFVQSIVDLKVPHMAPTKAIALIGDAAFVARPHVGAGVTKAAADADALARALAECDDINEALTRFDSIRRPFDGAIVDHARRLGAYMQAQQLSARERQMAEKHRQPQAVIRETAVPFEPDVHSLNWVA